MENDKKLDDILEIVTFIKDNALTKKEFHETTVTKNQFDEGLQELKNTIESKIDSVKSDLLNEIAKLRKATVEDTSALSQNYIKLEERIKNIEEQLKQLRLSNA